MAFDEGDSGAGHSFYCEVDGIAIGGITEVTGLTMERDVIELKHNLPGGKYEIRCLPGRRKGGHKVVLSRGITGENSFNEWMDATELGKMGDVRKHGAIEIKDYKGETVKRYVLTNLWACKWETTSLKAGATDVLVEKVTMTCDEITFEDG